MLGFMFLLLFIIINYGLKRAPFWQAALDSWAQKSQQILFFFLIYHCSYFPIYSVCRLWEQVAVANFDASEAATCWLQFIFPHQVKCKVIKVWSDSHWGQLCALGSVGLKVRELLAFAVPKIDPGSVWLCQSCPWILTAPSAERLDQPQIKISGAGMPLKSDVLDLWLGIQVGKSRFLSGSVNVFRAPQADLDLWPGLGTRSLGLAAASAPCLGFWRQLLTHLSHSSVCRTTFPPGFHFVHPITAKSAPLPGQGGSWKPFWTLPGLATPGSSVWFGFRESTAVVLPLFPVAGSRYFWVGFSLKRLKTSPFWIYRLMDTWAGVRHRPTLGRFFYCVQLFIACLGSLNFLVFLPCWSTGRSSALGIPQDVGARWSSV